MRRRKQNNIFGTWIDSVSREEALDLTLGWAEGRERRLVGFPALNSIFSNRTDKAFMGLYEGFDLVLNDGRNIDRIARLVGEQFAEPRIAGMDFLPEFIRRSGEKGVSVFVLCSSVATVELLPGMFEKLGGAPRQFAGAWVPPFQKTFTAEDLRPCLELIEQTKPQAIVIGIAAPKQEQVGKLLREHVVTPVTLFCLGGALETTVGKIPMAPQWIRNMGLESFYRFFKEPRRLFWRYLIYNLLVFPFTAEAMIKRWLKGEKLSREVMWE